jgi:hypothetical protein
MADSPEVQVTIAETVELLKQVGIAVDVDWVGPTVFSAATPHGRVLVAYGHNRDGWEAVLEAYDGIRQLPLFDGPAGLSTPRNIAVWVRDLVDDPLKFLC